MTAQQAVAEVLAAHVLSYSPLTEQDICVACGALAPEFSTRYDGLGDRARAHQADILSAADLLATPEHDAQVAARALREAAEAIPGSTSPNPVDPYDRAAEWLIEHAEHRYERQEGER